MGNLPISISIVALNEESNLERCLASVSGLARETVVVDAGSTDFTKQVAESYGAHFSHQDWLGYRDQKNVALKKCSQPWVLALDCDEEVSSELRRSIEEFFKNGDDQKFAGAWFNRKVWFLGRWITHGDWYPDRKLRLFRREGAVWGGSPEHDKIEIGGKTTRFAGDLHHFSFPTTNRFIEKINTFSDVFLQRQIDAKARWSLLTNLFRPFWRFFRAYVLRRGFLDGFPGYWIARATAFSTFVRYSRAYEHQVKIGSLPDPIPGKQPPQASSQRLKEMRIGLIYHQFKSAAGGLEGYLRGFTTHLAEDGHELILIGSTFDDVFPSIPHTTIHRIRCKGTKTHRMRQFAKRSAQCIAQLNLDVSLGFGRTYTQDLHRAGGGCHRVYSRFLPAHKRLKRKNKRELALEQRLYTGGETRHFVVNAHLVGQQIQKEYRVSPDRISVIHTPVDTAKFAPSTDPEAAKAHVCSMFGTDPDRPAFLFVSLSHRRKGLESLLEVWRELDADLWIAGAPLRLAHRRQITRLGLGARVHHLGQSGDIVPFYQAADGFLHPTLYDACANTVLQSMACGVPGLISSRDGASEFIRDAENGFLLGDPTDPSQLLDGILRIADLDPKNRQRVSESARQTVTPLTWESHLIQWQTTIKRVLSQSPSA